MFVGERNCQSNESREKRKGGIFLRWLTINQFITTRERENQSDQTSEAAETECAVRSVLYCTFTCIESDGLSRRGRTSTVTAHLTCELLLDSRVVSHAHLTADTHPECPCCRTTAVRKVRENVPSQWPWIECDRDFKCTATKATHCQGEAYAHGHTHIYKRPRPQPIAALIIMSVRAWCTVHVYAIGPLWNSRAGP